MTRVWVGGDDSFTYWLGSAEVSTSLQYIGRLGLYFWPGLYNESWVANESGNLQKLIHW